MNKRHIWRGLILMILLVCFATTAFAATYTTLRYRDEGEAVRQMQQALVSLGYSTGGTDGKFGPTTEKAVRQFQRDNGLTVDGVAGNATLTLLYSKVSGGGSANTGTPSGDGSATGGNANGYFGGNYATLKYGSRGERVKLLQQALNNLGFNAGTADGKFGTGTQRAVVAFQQANGLEADGKAGAMTLKTIEAQLAGDTGGTVVTTPPTSAPTSAPTTPPSSGNGGYTVPTRTLRRGYQGEDVKTVQTRLKELGYYNGSIDGDYGSGTMAAVRAFQSAHGLTADGLAGNATYRILFSSSAKPVGGATAAPTASPTPTVAPSASPAPGTYNGYVIPTRTLRKDYEGEDVKAVQSRLRELGYYNGSIDGKYGSGTMAAVRSFQEKNSLTVDGIAGTGTFRVLFSDGAKPANSAATPAPTATPDPSTYTTLRKGASGPAVAQMQSALANLGYVTDTNGVYGNTTVAAVKQFQQANGLTVDGVAGVQTLTKLYSGTAVGPNTNSTETLPPSAGTTVTAPDISQVQLLYWQRDIKPTLKSRAHFLIYDPATGLSWTLQLLSAGRHADSEPLTATDTAVMFKAFGNQNTWNQKPVFVRLPDGRWTIGATHNTPHLSGNIKDNNFDGHLCLHLLRDMSEAEKNDPKYGVANQKTIREFWKSLTGQEIPYK